MFFSLSDLILAAFLILALIGGWRAGTVRVLSRFAAIIIAYTVARMFSGWLAWLVQGWLPHFAPATEAGEKLLVLLYLFCDVDGMVARLLGFVAFIVLFLVTMWLVKRIANLISDAFGHGLLGHIDSFLGAVVSVIIASVALLLFDDILFPVLAQLGLSGPQDFMDGSRLVLPELYRLLRLL